jgi:hypothetical protein
MRRYGRIDLVFIALWVLGLAVGSAGAWPATDGSDAASQVRTGNAAATAPAGDRQDYLERFDTVQDVQGVGLVTVDNPYGDVRLRFGGREPQLEVAAVLQQLCKDGRRLEVTVRPASDPAAVSVRVALVSKDGAPAQDVVSRAELGQSRADLFVLVPAVGLAVRAEARDGLLECRGVRADVELSTRAGTIDCRGVKGRITATSDRGEIKVVLVPGATDLPQVLTTTTGDISVFASDAADLDVVLSSSGELTTDFSVDIEHHDHEEPGKVATATVGAGGHALEMRSKRGHLQLRRLLPPQDGGAADGVEPDDGAVPIQSREVGGSVR